jgi:small-conductance mechanosensitive channel
MEIYVTKIIESLVVIVLFILVRSLVNRLISKTIVKKLLQKSRSELIRKAINIIMLTISIIFITIIWGVKQTELAVFVGSVLTVVGVAMFAQWSLLSNITSSIVIFFNHFVKIGDTIAIMEAKDYQILGRVEDIDLFFVKLKTLDTEEIISLPNNIFVQKTIKKVNENELTIIQDKMVDGGQNESEENTAPV